MQTSSTPTVARRAFVSGRVQGVWFRGAAAERAASLGVRGYARNLADGRVEVLAVGAEGAVEALVEWLHRGPPAAHVTGVVVEVVEPAPAVEGFARR
jgi:acylphosphatase